MKRSCDRLSQMVRHSYQVLRCFQWIDWGAEVKSVFVLRSTESRQIREGAVARRLVEWLIRWNLRESQTSGSLPAFQSGLRDRTPRRSRDHTLLPG